MLEIDPEIEAYFLENLKQKWHTILYYFHNFY